MASASRPVVEGRKRWAHGSAGRAGPRSPQFTDRLRALTALSAQCTMVTRRAPVVIAGD